MNNQKNKSKANWKGSGDFDKSGDFKKIIKKFGINQFTGYQKNPTWRDKRKWFPLFFIDFIAEIHSDVVKF